MIRLVMSFYLVVLEDGRAKVVPVPDDVTPNVFSHDYVVVDQFTVLTEAEERCAIENDPTKRALMSRGKLKIKRTPL